MKTLIKPHRFLTVVLSLTATLFWLGSSSASGQSASPKEELYKGLDLQISHGLLMNDGREPVHGEATLSNIVTYLAAMQRSAAEHSPIREANIVLGDGLGSLKIDDLQLQHAPLDLALQALSVASGDKFTVKEVRSKETPALLYMLETNKSSAPETKVEAFNLSGYVQHIKRSTSDTNNWERVIGNKIGDLQAIVQQVVDEQRTLEKISRAYLKFKFFVDSDLLIIIGPPDAVATAGKIIRALPGEDDQRGLRYLLAPEGQDALDSGANLQNDKFLQQLAKP
jgi:hypothetical protein